MLSGFAFRLLADPELAVGIDAPRELEEELDLLPDLARVRLAAVLGDALAELLARDAEHVLAEADPATGVRLLALVVVALARVAWTFCAKYTMRDSCSGLWMRGAI